MKQSRRCSVPVCTLAVIGVGAFIERAAACAVCFGDPASPMAQGALMGVVTLGAIIGFVLLAIAGTGAYWIHRGLRLSRIDQATSAPPESD